MVLRYSLFFVFMFFFNALYAEDLDTLITKLAKAQTTEEPAPGTPAVVSQPEPKPLVTAPTPVEPKFEPKPFPAPEPKPMVEPKIVGPKVFTPMPEPKPVFTPGVAEQREAPKVAAPVVAKAQPVLPQVVVQPGEVSTVTDQGLDTLGIDSSGNWLEKRIWYQKAEQMFEEIRKSVERASDIRMKFVHEVSVVGKHIDDFYEKVSFEKGQVDELLKALLGSLTTEEKVRGGDLSSAERDIKLQIHQHQQELESIETNMKMITSLDEQVEKTMIKAFNEIDACRSFENKAWNNFKDIGMELDDKKARTLYYEMDNFYKNIQKKMDYLQNNLYEYLVQQLASKITQTTSQIQTTVQGLKTKGMNLEELLTKDAAGDFVILKQRDEMMAQHAAKAAQAHVVEAKKTSEEKVAKTAWYQNLWCTFLEYLCPILTKLSEWGAIILCCIQTLICKIQELICRLLGY